MNPNTLAALAEPHRLMIVELLRERPRPVNEIVRRLDLNQPQVSKHLRVLSDAGLVRSEAVAQQRFYQLQPIPFREIDKWIEQYRKLWEARFDRLDAMLREEKLKMKKQKGS